MMTMNIQGFGKSYDELEIHHSPRFMNENNY